MALLADACVHPASQEAIALRTSTNACRPRVCTVALAEMMPIPIDAVASWGIQDCVARQIYLNVGRVLALTAELVSREANLFSVFVHLGLAGSNVKLN